ncbi:hypothetical protein [Sulfurospirillum barnesii]|uniref:Uncharacterized protein n=1 Tax=Sulfurospirillum barnesii (strain ATCC 700032 / DSM 10660 / SES-3) TaxID=760154 RepID=I3XWE4_SULBS|nr:hypothetical protein [Sulfurospirillum barnesii]AFL68268.1 hypothetical protein Sulba_0967 [Sulfurospirillum barnesii SES-3]
MKLIKSLGITALVAVGAFAADEPWYTDLTTQLTSIKGMVITVISAVIAISLAPLGWAYVKRVINRG